MVIPYLYVKCCQKEKDEKSGHVGMGLLLFKACYRFLRAGDTVYVQFTFVQRMGFIPYAVMSWSCVEWLCLSLENFSVCFRRWWGYNVNGVLLVALTVQYVQQCFSWVGVLHPLLPTDSFSNMLQKGLHFLLLRKDGNDWNRLNKNSNKFWMCLIL